MNGVSRRDKFGFLTVRFHHKNFNEVHYVAFIDFEKAFDSIDIWIVLESL